MEGDLGQSFDNLIAAVDDMHSAVVVAAVVADDEEGEIDA